MEDPLRAKLYHTAQGFGCLFWAILLWAAGALCLEKAALGWKALMLISLAYLLPLFEGFMALRDAEPLRCRRTLLRFAILLGITVAYLTPLAVWWRLAPSIPFLAYNALAFHLAACLFLYAQCRLVPQYAAWLPDPVLRSEASIASVMVIFLDILSIALLWHILRDWPDRSIPALLLALLTLDFKARILLALPAIVVAYLPLRARRAILGRLLTAAD
jgi:hypothetical protein